MFKNPVFAWALVIIIGGILIFWPPRPEPVCIVCLQFIFDRLGPIILVALGAIGTYQNRNFGKNINAR